MAASRGECSVFEKDSVVRGYHIYKVYWTPVIEVELALMTEYDNEQDEQSARCRCCCRMLCAY